MSVLTRHAPGTVCWMELGTNDQNGARRFYTGLFGWRADESPMPDGTTYTMFMLGDQAVAACYQQNPKNSPPGVPPMWTTYFAVDSADTAAARAKASGGKVLAEPFDVMDYGRMAVLADSIGGVFAVWQPKSNPGLGRKGEAGAVTWVQLNAPDPGAAAGFYQNVLGWGSGKNGDYVLWMVGQEPVGGGMPMPPGVTAPAHWLVYFGAADVDASAATAEKLGGRVMVKPSDIPTGGRFCVLADPQGAMFTLMSAKA